MVPGPDEQRLGPREAAANSGPGALGLEVSRIAEATAVRGETAAKYLRAAGLVVRRRGRPSEAPAKAAIVAEVSLTPQNRQFPDYRCFAVLWDLPLIQGR